MQGRLLHLDQVYFPPAPPTREEIDALLFEDVSRVELLVAWDAMLFCPCAFASDRRACLRQLWMPRLHWRPRARARRRQRRGGSSCKRGPPDDGDGDGPPGPSPHDPAGAS